MPSILPVNIDHAVYHRSYEGPPEPIKVYLYPDRMEIISHPGPVPGIEARHLDGSTPLPPVPARNRRIGELLKELKLAEGRGTGIPKVRRVMQQNGSPPPVFDFDGLRTYFRVTLPAHPEYRAMLALQDVGRLKAIGDQQEASLRLRRAFDQEPRSLGLAIEMCRECVAEGDLHAAQEVYRRFTAANPFESPASLIHMIAGAWLDRGARTEARSWLDRLQESDALNDNFEAAIQEKRAGRLELAHKDFMAAGQAVQNDAKALHEFAQVKKKLSAGARRQRGSSDSASVERRLLEEAGEMLRRVVQMDVPSTRRAWAWSDLGDVLQRLGAPIHEIRHAYEEALRLQPTEPRFQQNLGKVGH